MFQLKLATSLACCWIFVKWPGGKANYYFKTTCDIKICIKDPEN